MNKLPDVFYEAPKELVEAIANYGLGSSTFGNAALTENTNRVENIYSIIKPIMGNVNLEIPGGHYVEIKVHFRDPLTVRLDIEYSDTPDSVLWTALKPYLKEEYQGWLDKLLPFMIQCDEEDRVKTL